MRSCERYTSPFQATARCRSRVAKPQRLCAHFFKSALGSILEKVDRYITFARAKIRKNFGKANSFVPPVSFCLPDARLLIRRSAAGGVVARRYPPAGEKWRRRNAARKSCSHKKRGAQLRTTLSSFYGFHSGAIRGSLNPNGSAHTKVFRRGIDEVKRAVKNCSQKQRYE